jgi:MAP3K TRAFs-binding domain
LGGYRDMVDLVERRMGPTVRSMTVVREQYGFALNRVGRRDVAETTLKALIDERGPSSETYGLLGRVLKDRWLEAVAADDEFVASGLLDQAITAYRTGFETDWRDPYPGVNAVELMEVRGGARRPP